MFEVQKEKCYAILRDVGVRSVHIRQKALMNIVTIVFS